MRAKLDRRGRITIPRLLREELGLSPGMQLEVGVVGNRVELWAHREPPVVIEGTGGPVVARTGTVISDEDVRQLLEAARVRRPELAARPAFHTGPI
jgi:AbrB family looped-hinge helix DNA binding protein